MRMQIVSHHEENPIEKKKQVEAQYVNSFSASKIGAILCDNQRFEKRTNEEESINSHIRRSIMSCCCMSKQAVSQLCR